MRIYDISQELLGCCVYPGDPKPEAEKLRSISAGDGYNLTGISMCAHNGTHLDAPLHFIDGGCGIDGVCLESVIGYAFVCEAEGDIGAEEALAIIKRAKELSRKRGGCDASLRILIKGRAVVTLEAAERFAAEGARLIGNESQTVGPEDAPIAVHKCLLGAGCVLLEGIRLAEVPEGIYFLSAQPILIAGADGAPCRAVLVGLD